MYLYIPQSFNFKLDCQHSAYVGAQICHFQVRKFRKVKSLHRRSSLYSTRVECTIFRGKSQFAYPWAGLYRVWVVQNVLLCANSVSLFCFARFKNVLSCIHSFANLITIKTLSFNITISSHSPTRILYTQHFLLFTHTHTLHITFLPANTFNTSHCSTLKLLTLRCNL